MRKRKIWKSKLVGVTKDHIRKVFPQARSIDLRLRKDSSGHYLSQIKVDAGQGHFFASKRSKSFKKSLDKAYQALYKQMDKYKRKSKRYNQRDLVFDELAPI